MSKDPIGDDARRHQQERRHGKGSVCILCAEPDPAALMVVPAAVLDTLPKAVRTLLELDHVVGRAHDADLTIPLCRNCHAKLTVLRMAAGISMRPAPTAIEREVLILRGLEVFFPELGKSCGRRAERMERHVDGLDRDHPGWRRKPWAK